MTRTNSMFHRPMKLLAAGSLVFAALLAAQPAVAQLITGSKHDLSTRTTGAGAAGTTEVCVFCHTPHGASTGSATGGLLWNRAPPASPTFNLYASATLDSTALQPMSRSNLCFSCHDGATSIDNMVNKPGSGGYTSGGAVTGYTPFANPGALTGILNISLGAVANDLSNDHPIGVAYCGGFAANTCRDLDFKFAAGTRQLNRKLFSDGSLLAGTAAAIPGASENDQYWIDVPVGGTQATRDKTDMILFARTFSAPTAGIFPSVECTSCHEPHDSSSFVTGVSVGFLRTTNAASGLCLSCHTK